MQWSKDVKRKEDMEVLADVLVGKIGLNIFREPPLTPRLQTCRVAASTHHLSCRGQRNKPMSFCSLSACDWLSVISITDEWLLLRALIALETTVPVVLGENDRMPAYQYVYFYLLKLVSHPC